MKEIRLKKGKPDDIVIGRMHLEQMDNGFWWLGYYIGNKRITFHILSKSKIKVELIENGIEAKIVEET